MRFYCTQCTCPIWYILICVWKGVHACYSAVWPFDTWRPKYSRWTAPSAADASPLVMGYKNGTVVFTVILHLNCSCASAAHMPAPFIPPGPYFHFMELLTPKKAIVYSCLTFIIPKLFGIHVTSWVRRRIATFRLAQGSKPFTNSRAILTPGSLLRSVGSHQTYVGLTWLVKIKKVF